MRWNWNENNMEIKSGETNNKKNRKIYMFLYIAPPILLLSKAKIRKGK